MPKGKRPYVALYANRRAGWRFRRWSDLDQWSLGAGIKIYALTDIEEIDAIIARFGEEIKLLFVYGGDGTLFWVINSLLCHRRSQNMPIIVPVGGGTMNRLRQWTMWIGEPAMNAQEALSLFEQQRLPVLSLPLLEVKWGANHFHSVTFIAGAPVRVLRQYSGFKTTPFVAGTFTLGSVAAGLLNWPHFFTRLYGQLSAMVMVDGQELPYKEYIVIIKDTLKRLIFIMEPYRGSCAPDQSFSLAYAVDYHETARNFWRLCFGHPPKDDRYFNQPSGKMTVTPTEKMLFTLDGEFFEAKAGETVTISQGVTIPVAVNPFVHLTVLHRLLSQKERVEEILSWVFPMPKKR